MERVAFLVEASGERISCLLNPEHLDARRVAGVRTRIGGGGVLAGEARADDPLIPTGGGLTEFDLRLLFDVDVANQEAAIPGRSGDASEGGPARMPRYSDVRELTRPLWNLAENAHAVEGYSAVPTVRFIWGKCWNVPCVVLAVAERFERFTPDGMPGRSWLSLRLRRIEDPSPLLPVAEPATPQFEFGDAMLAKERQQESAVEVPSDPEGHPLVRLDEIAARAYGRADLHRLIGEHNQLDDLLGIEGARVLSLPRLDQLGGQ